MVKHLDAVLLSSRDKVQYLTITSDHLSSYDQVPEHLVI